ncbi:hypothetical protein BDZ85DRAFT_71809 [Elsinoe ampelina]|uniref:Uncharacterized protein n=1 Tax=Elsinoe ampelina TaxID=302913 RepID=A0A6A6GJ87_9PEZI|nr:hypothetical protein BDZ85DRAFT_71809 [Elsinoe ampelina]
MRLCTDTQLVASQCRTENFLDIARLYRRWLDRVPYGCSILDISVYKYIRLARSDRIMTVHTSPVCPIFSKRTRKHHSISQRTQSSIIATITQQHHNVLSHRRPRCPPLHEDVPDQQDNLRQEQGRYYDMYTCCKPIQTCTWPTSPDI